MKNMVLTYSHVFSPLGNHSQDDRIPCQKAISFRWGPESFQEHECISYILQEVGTAWVFLLILLLFLIILCTVPQWVREPLFGIIDTGIWPESASLNDEGLGPTPNR